MENLFVQKSKDTLGINFNAETGILEMLGNSYPENSMSFFTPIYEWLDCYIKTIGKSITLNCKIDYFNTSTSKCFLEIFDILNSYYESGKEVKINWYFKEGDIDTEETGEELLEDYKLPYETIEY